MSFIILSEGILLGSGLLLTCTIQPQMWQRQREYQSKTGSEGFEFKYPSDEEDVTYLYTDLHEQHQTSKQKRSKHLYRCWCVAGIIDCVAFLSWSAFSIIIQTLLLLYHHANQYISCCCIYAEGDYEDDDDENYDVKKHSGPALGLPVLSKCVPVVGQAYMALCVWSSFYSIWTVLGRELSETGPIFKPMLFLFLRNFFSMILLVVLVLLLEGCRIRSLRPRKRDLCLTLAYGAACWIDQLLYIYGLRFTTTTNSALLIACIPVYSMVIGLVIGSEVLGKGYNCVKKVLGIFFCTGGAVFVILTSDQAQDHLNMLLHSRPSEHLYENVILWIASVRCHIPFSFKNHGSIFAFQNHEYTSF